jgi:hypothetical protein
LADRFALEVERADRLSEVLRARASTNRRSAARAAKP